MILVREEILSEVPHRMRQMALRGDDLMEFLWGLAFWAIGLYFLYFIIRAAIDASETARILRQFRDIDASQTAQNIREIKDILRTINSRSLSAVAKPQDDRLTSDDI